MELINSQLPYPATWTQLTHEQKRAWRFQNWADSANQIQFVSSDAEKMYRTRVSRLSAVLQVKEPDQVPVAISAGFVPCREAGISYKTAIYEPEKAVQACQKFNEKHMAELDSFTSVPTIPAEALEVLDYRLYAWPGHGMPDGGTGYQYLEGEYMLANEYDDLLRDPSDFWLRVYLPRVFRSLATLKQFSPLTDIAEVHIPHFNWLARTDVQEAMQKLLDAGKALSRYFEISGGLIKQAMANGFPELPKRGVVRAPFDKIGDTMRGTNGIMKDMYRQPAKLLRALDLLADTNIQSVLNSPVTVSGLHVRVPLHKGADNWMSQKQFETFYWPSLKKIMDALINEGLIITLFAEGGYNTRLDYVNQFPKGTVHWQFDQTDMARAKIVLGANNSIEGNVPTSLLVTGTPEEVKEYCRRLIEVCAPGGGFLLGPGAQAEFPRVENLKAMVEAAREYGTYKK